MNNRFDMNNMNNFMIRMDFDFCNFSYFDQNKRNEVWKIWAFDRLILATLRFYVYLPFMILLDILSIKYIRYNDD